MKNFRGVWGVFPYLDDTTEVIRTIQAKGLVCNVFSPCPRHEINEALGDPQSRLPFIALIFGALGLFFGYGLPIWTALDWVLPVSQKPIVSIPAYTIIGFELMILLGGLSTAAGIFILGALALLRNRPPSSPRFRAYSRFSVDRFGIAVACADTQAEEIEQLMHAHAAEEVIRER